MISNEKEQLNIEIIDTVFDPLVYGADSKPTKVGEKYEVFYEEGEDLALYKVWLFLKGNDLPFVDYVTYNLHETFSNPEIRVIRSVSNAECRTFIWTWGIFEIVADIVVKSGRTYRLNHYLNYGKTIEKYKDEIQYIQESSRYSSGATLI